MSNSRLVITIQLDEPFMVGDAIIIIKKCKHGLRAVIEAPRETTILRNTLYLESLLTQKESASDTIQQN